MSPGVPTVAPSSLLVAGFIVLPLALFLMVVIGVAAAGARMREPRAQTRRAVTTTVVVGVSWLALSAVAAASGALRRFDETPPPFAALVLGILTLASVIAFTGYGDRLIRGLSVPALVAFQSFRLPLELLMHRAAVEGVMPDVMSYTGRNFDILTGITALIVAPVAARRGGRRIVAVWNVLGFALLLNVMAVSIMATPRFRYFGEDQLNVWVTYVPFVWLPAVMVLLALSGHLLVFRALAR